MKKEETMRTKFYLLMLLTALLSLVSPQASFALLPDTTKPTVTVFTIPALSNSLVVPIMSLNAIDNSKVTGYLVTQSQTAPLPNDKRWSAVEPANYTFLAPGTKRLYAWAKDRAGNVSLAKSAKVIIAQLDGVKPAVTLFTVPATSTSLRVPILGLAATDNAGVTGYFVTGNSKPPLAGQPGWYPVPPPNYNYTFLPDPLHSNIKTLYAWAKDAAGNVSPPMTATVTINQTDMARPVVTGFTVVPAVTPKTAKISLFTATDNVAVTGYRVTTTKTAPLAGAFGWTFKKPHQITFPTAGVKKVYGWAKDAAGNVSLAQVATVTLAPPIGPAQALIVPPTPAAMALLPLPTGGGALEIGYDPTETPVISADPAQAMPMGFGLVASGGDSVTLETALAQLDGPADVYLDLRISSGDGTKKYSLDSASNAFVPVSDTALPWRSGVVELKETIWEQVPVADLPAGAYTFTLKVTPAGESGSHYSWTVSFSIR